MPDLHIGDDWIVEKNDETGKLEITHDITGETYLLDDTGNFDIESLSIRDVIELGLAEDEEALSEAVEGSLAYIDDSDRSPAERLQIRTSSDVVAPDDVLFHFPMAEGEGRGTADPVDGHGGELVDDVMWDSSEDWFGGYALTGNGVSTYVLASHMKDLGERLDKNFSIAFTAYPESDAMDVIGQVKAGGNGPGIRINFTGTQRFAMQIRDESANTLSISSDDALNYPKLYRVIITKSGNTANDLTIYINSVDRSGGTTDEGLGNVGPFEAPMPLLARWQPLGELSQPWEGKIDNLIIYDKALTQEEIEEDYQLQPWSDTE